MEIAERESKIKKEILRLSKIFKNIDGEKKIFIEKQIRELAFMQVTLEEIQERVKLEGVTEEFINGKQRFQREHSLLKIYNTMIKNYNSTIKELINYFPEGEKVEQDELIQFLSGN